MRVVIAGIGERTAGDQACPALKVGLLLAQRPVAAWEQAMLAEIAKSDYADITVWIQPQENERNHFRTFLERRLAAILEYWERRLHIEHDACEMLDISNLVPGAMRFELAEEQRAGASRIADSVITDLLQCDLDAVIALDEHDDLAALAAIATYGILYLRHATTAALFGSPAATAGLSEVLERRPHMESSLLCLNDPSSDTSKVCVTYSNVNPLLYRRTRSQHFWTVSHLIPRWLNRLREPERNTIVDDTRCQHPDRGWRFAFSLSFTWLSYLFYRSKMAVRRRLGSERWILMVNSGQDPYDLGKYSMLEPREGWFWADPCVVQEHGQYFVFFEEASLDSGKGHIAVITLDDDGVHSEPVRILEKSYHLSYPFVFRYQDDWYMIPESSENRSVELFRCRGFPHDWVFERNLMQGVWAYDATVFEHNGDWWMFASSKEHPGASGWDELNLYYADDPIHAEWVPHPMNPIVSDVRSARPAGRVFRTEGRIIRPSQDSSLRYGFRLQFNEIMELSRTHYRERAWRSIEPDNGGPIQGVHTFSRCGDLTVIDAMHRVRKSAKRNSMKSANRADRAGYDDHYKGTLSGLGAISDRDTYIKVYEAEKIGPYYLSGVTKGYVKGEALKRMIADADSRGTSRSELTVLDAGSGQGELSVYLACKGFKVIAVDISTEAKICGERLASNVGVLDKCEFLAESLEKTSVVDSSVDYVVGHASLHHFIKYEGVPAEFLRVMKDNAKGFFADAFGENKLFHIFHNKEKMERLGDVSLTREMLDFYFRDFEVTLTPTDWFVMLDKLYLKILPKSFVPIVKKLSRFHFWLDRKLPQSSRTALRLSGSVMTEIAKH